jgi:TRAP-type transport system periplasmic protein
VIAALPVAENLPSIVTILLTSGGADRVTGVCGARGARRLQGGRVMRLLASLAIAAVLLLCADGALARELKISHQWPEATDARDRAVRIFVKEVESRAPELQFRIYPRLTLNIPAEKQFDALQSGELDMCICVPPYSVDKVPEFSLAVLPGLYPSLDAVSSLRGSKLIEHLQSVANRHGVHFVTWWWVPGGFVTRNREIGGPETVKGLRLRSGDKLFDVMLAKAGAIPVSMTSDRLYAAIKSGEIDGTLTSYETFVSTKIYEHAKFFTAGSPGIWMFLNSLMISKTVWDDLSEEQRAVMEAAARISEEYFERTQRDAEERFVDIFTRAGAKARTLGREEYLAWLHLAQQTAWAEYLTISPGSKTMLYDTIETLLAGGLR